MHNNNDVYFRVKAIEGAAKLIQEYNIDRCIHAAHRLCNVIQDKTESLRELHAESDYDPCLDAVMDLSTMYYGCRQLLSALLFLKGDRIGSEIWQQKHLLGVSRIFDKSELNDSEED